MPIIPANWTGQELVNAIGGSGGGSVPSYQFAKSVNVTIEEINTFIDLIGVVNEPINREISLDIISGKIKLYWKLLSGDYQLINFNELNFDSVFIDCTLGQLGLSVKASEVSEIFFNIKWDKDIDFSIYEPDIIPPGLTVEILGSNATITNYQDTENFFLSFDYSQFSSSSNNYIIICPRRSFDGTFDLDYGGYYSFTKNIEVLPSNELISLTIDFTILSPDWVNVFRFGIGYDDSEVGLRYNDSKPTTLTYDPLTRTFTLTAI